VPLDSRSLSPSTRIEKGGVSEEMRGKLEVGDDHVYLMPAQIVAVNLLADAMPSHKTLNKYL